MARVRYAPGDQVFLCYGRHTNLQLLQHYGFTLRDNPHEEVLVPLPLLDAQISKARRNGSEAAVLNAMLPASDCFLHANGQPSWELVRALRYVRSAGVSRPMPEACFVELLIPKRYGSYLDVVAFLSPTLTAWLTWLTHGTLTGSWQSLQLSASALDICLLPASELPTQGSCEHLCG